jgi:DNA mismatch repair ATPase MutS
VSLLWPAGRGAADSFRLGDQALADLQLDQVIRAIAGSLDSARAGRLAARERFARDVLTDLVHDPKLIEHRQAILTDLIENPPLCKTLEELLPSLEALGEAPRGERYRPTMPAGLESVARRLAELELLVDAVVALVDALESAVLVSDGFRSLERELRELRETQEFASLERELPGLRATLSSVRSVTLGVNLAADLSPESATILELGSTPVDGRRALLFRLLGGGSGTHGLTPLQRGEAGPLGRPNELVRDLRHLLADVVGPVQAALERFSRVSSASVSQLGSELALLLGTVRLFNRIRSVGLPLCRAHCADPEERSAELIDLYDIALALTLSASSEPVVTNEARFDGSGGRVWVLTGPNRGGKTTYTRAVGLAQVLFQVGLYVPASSARISPVDAIHTHFPVREELVPGAGRLDAEAERLSAIFHQATAHSLILLNEALSGTSALEALDLARGLVRALRLLGARAIYVTHLHELANGVDEINATTPGDGTVGSLLAVRCTYRVVAGPPTGISFAAEIAEQHGISFAQIAELLRQRHLT